MTDAPERIWAFTGGRFDGEWNNKRLLASDTEYTRSDLIPAMIAEAVARERERGDAVSDSLSEAIAYIQTMMLSFTHKSGKSWIKTRIAQWDNAIRDRKGDAS